MIAITVFVAIARAYDSESIFLATMGGMLLLPAILDCRVFVSHNKIIVGGSSILGLC